MPGVHGVYSKIVMQLHKFCPIATSVSRGIIQALILNRSGEFFVLPGIICRHITYRSEAKFPRSQTRRSSKSEKRIQLDSSCKIRKIKKKYFFCMLHDGHTLLKRSMPNIEWLDPCKKYQLFFPHLAVEFYLEDEILNWSAKKNSNRPEKSFLSRFVSISKCNSGSV